jgi:hypothetical protein
MKDPNLADAQKYRPTSIRPATDIRGAGGNLPPKDIVARPAKAIAN